MKRVILRNHASVGGGGWSGKEERERRNQNHPALGPFYIPNIQGVLNLDLYQISTFRST